MANGLQKRQAGTSRWADWPFRRLFEDLYQGVEDETHRLPQLWGEGRFVPAVDVSEDEDHVILTAEVPGMSPDDLDVTVDNGILTIRGEKKGEATSEKAGYHRIERRYGQFERRVRLPDYVDVEKIAASYKDGVLKLEMPKSEAAKARSIQIKG